MQTKNPLSPVISSSVNTCPGEAYKKINTSSKSLIFFRLLEPDLFSKLLLWEPPQHHSQPREFPAHTIYVLPQVNSSPYEEHPFASQFSRYEKKRNWSLSILSQSLINLYLSITQSSTCIFSQLEPCYT